MRRAMLLVILAGAALAQEGPAPKPRPAPKSPTIVRDPNWWPKVGDQATIVVGSGSRVFLATGRDSFSEVEQAAKARDETGLRQLIEAGRALAVTAPTKVIVLGTIGGSPARASGNQIISATYPHALEVRIKEGPNAERTGIVLSRNVARLVEVRKKKAGRR